jgi:hypothetical protein
MQAFLAVVSDDPSGMIWIMAAINLITAACALWVKFWRSNIFRFVVVTQLLVTPAVAAIGFHYATQPVL